jgi:hypothetical protein
MKLRIANTVLFSLLFVMMNCKEDEPVYPVEPYIEFKDMQVKEEGGLDSVIMKFYIRDGDFDLGLSEEELGYPYHWLWYFDKDQSKLIAVNQIEGPDPTSLLVYSDRNNPPFDTIPEFIKPYNCSNYNVIRNDFGQVIDTAYIQPNKYHHNLIIDFQVKQEDASWLTYNFEDILSYPNCFYGFKGRFQLQNFGRASGSPFYSKRISRQEMFLTYSIASPAFRFLFKDKTVRFQVYIYDRALNKSNIVYSSEIQFQD